MTKNSQWYFSWVCSFIRCSVQNRNWYLIGVIQDEKPCAYYMCTGACKFGIACKFHHPQPDPAVSVTGPFHYRSTDSSGYLMEVDFLHGHSPKQHTCMLLIQEVHRPTCQLFILPLKGCYLHQNGTLTWLVRVKLVVFILSLYMHQLSLWTLWYVHSYKFVIDASLG